jgi:phage replication-related protein YjqB (UPF0714/DUF867 family)
LLRDDYQSFAELRASHAESRDFDRTLIHRVGSNFAILALHGGRLENHTDTIAERIAGADFSLYCFRSRLGPGAANLHITSHKFDDPDCIALVGRHPSAVAVHGCAEPGELVFLGGRDQTLCDALADSLQQAGICAQLGGHKYPGLHPNNICNRTACGAGVQIELTMQLRRSGAVPVFVDAVRNVLLAQRHENFGLKKSN